MSYYHRTKLATLTNRLHVYFSLLLCVGIGERGSLFPLFYSISSAYLGLRDCWDLLCPSFSMLHSHHSQRLKPPHQEPQCLCICGLWFFAFQNSTDPKQFGNVLPYPGLTDSAEILDLALLLMVCKGTYMNLSNQA